MPKSIGGFGESKEDKEKQARELEDRVRDAFRESAESLAGERGGNSRGGDDRPTIPLNMQQDARLARQETLTVGAAADTARVKALADQAELDAEAKTKYGLSDAAGVLGSPVIGVAKLAGKFAMQQAAGASARKKTFDANNMEEGFRGNTLLGRQGGEGDNEPSVKPVTPVASEVEAAAPKPVTPEDVSEFTTKARKKKGYLSTILGGGVSPNFPQGKTLLGS